LRTAKVHIPLIDGIYSGRARCYELDPPLIEPDNGVERPYVTVVVQPGRAGHQLPEVHVFAAEPQFGGPVGYSMQKLPGSCTLYSLPDDPEHGWQYALMQLGVTAIV
jgi:hypothetical protein